MSRKAIDTPADGPRVKISAMAVKSAMLWLEYPNERRRIPAPAAAYRDGKVIGWMDARAH